MVAVAVVGLLYPLYRAFRVQEACKHQAIIHEEKRKYLELEFKNMGRFPSDFAGAVTADRRRELLALDAVRAERIRMQAEYHGRMKAKYVRAASRPWSTIEPDLPEPP
jgi:hypothetical protein